jgi:TolB-like protein
MKKSILFLLFNLFCINLFSQQFTINEATINASQEISQRLPVGSLFAVINIESLSDDLSLHIIGLLETGLVHSERLQIVSRQRIQTVMNEQDFGMSGYVDDNTAQRIGRLLGARFVLTGEIIKPENRYFLNIQVLETETAIIMYSKSYEIRNSELRNYEQLILLKQRQERMEREQLIRDEERRQRDEINRINAQERKRKWDNFIKAISPNFDFGNWSPVPSVSFEIGYIFTPGMPLGFTIGTFGLYTSFNFAIPNWQGYQVNTYYTYNSDNRINGGYYSEYGSGFRDRGNRAYEAIEWTVGYSINILNGFLMIPLGIGANHTGEYRLFDETGYGGSLEDTEWYGPSYWSSKIVVEAGLQLVFKYVTIFSTYRLTGFEKSSFTIGAGYILLN